MKISVLVEIESSEILGAEEVKSIEGMTEEESLAFLVKDVPAMEARIRDELMLSGKDIVRINFKLEDDE